MINQVELFSEQLASEQEDLVLERVAQCVRLANKAYEVDLPVPPIRFSVKGTAWGYYQRRGKHVEIRFNPLLFARYFQEGLEDTVPHEIAHYFVDSMYTGRPKPHGPEWREVMNLFGIENPRATSDYDTSGLGVRKQKRMKYRCACQIHEVSKTRHNRMLRGSKYLCRSCNQELEFCVEENFQPSVESPEPTGAEVAGSRRRKQQRIKYRCACEIHEVSKTRHNRMQRGTKYQCRTCGQELELYLEENASAATEILGDSKSDAGVCAGELAAAEEHVNTCAAEPRTFAYKCACEIHVVSETRHNRILSGTKYQCRTCHQDLELHLETDLKAEENTSTLSTGEIQEESDSEPEKYLYLYTCACEIHEVSKKRHKRMQRGIEYQCRLCNEDLVPYHEEDSGACSSAD